MASRKQASKGQLVFGLVQPVLRTDGYCGSCNVTSRDIFVHRASEAHMAGRYRRSIRNVVGGPMPSAHKVAVAASFRSLRDWDKQDDDIPNSPSWDEEFNRA